MNKDFTLSSGQNGATFIRSEFDYGIRQRAGLRGYDTFNANLILNATEAQDWLSFWDALNDGVDAFTCDVAINMDLTTGKTVRFTSGYSTKQIGNGYFELSVPLELISTGV